MNSKEQLDLKLRLALKNYKITFICEQWCKLLNCSSEEAHGQDIGYFLSKKNPLNAQNTESLLNKKSEVEMISLSGNSLFIEILLQEDATTDNDLILYGSDITDLRKAQLKLRQLEHHAKVGYWERNKNGISSWSDEIYHIFGVPVAPIGPEFYASLKGVFQNEGQLKILEQLEHIFTSGGSYDLELEIKTPEGERKWVRTTGTGIEHNGEIIRIEGMIQDVSTYRNNILKIFESQERLRFALNANDMGVWELNLKTDELIWDENMCKMYGLKPEDAPKNTNEFYALIHPDDVGRFHADSRESMKTKHGLFSSWFRTIVNGEVRYISVRGGYNHSSGNDSYIGVNWDITKEMMAEETIRLQEAKIITSARLASLGEMAGGVAHEINNPLSVILARTNQLKRRVLKNEMTQEELVEGLTKVEETCNRIVKIINGLRTISREGNNDPFESISLQECLNETITLISEKLKNNNVKISVVTPETDVVVRGRTVQIEQVLMNILNNAYDAVSNATHKEIKVELLQLDNEVQIRIKDSGPGVPNEIIDSVFAPFFTTKEIGKGTGIGLSISKSIIEEHGGELAYFSADDDWYFYISLPFFQADI